MIVMTRWVTEGSAGSGECIDRFVIEIIDLEHDHVTIGLERPKVVLLVRVVRVAKVVEHRDGLDDPFDGRWAERRHAWRHDGHSAGEMLTQLIVQRANARSLRVHGKDSRLWDGEEVVPG